MSQAPCAPAPLGGLFAGARASRPQAFGAVLFATPLAFRGLFWRRIMSMTFASCRLIVVGGLMTLPPCLDLLLDQRLRASTRFVEVGASNSPYFSLLKVFARRANRDRWRCAESRSRQALLTSRHNSASSTTLAALLRTRHIPVRARQRSDSDLVRPLALREDPECSSARSSRGRRNSCFLNRSRRCH